MSDELLRVFVYGTLKQDQHNHAHYCRGVLAVEPATVSGRLFHLAAGYPMLVVPPQAMIAIGTNDPHFDLATQLRFAQQSEVELLRPSSTVGTPSADDDWEAIEGEVITFADPRTALPQLDRLEDFRPESPTSSYLRVLVATRDEGAGHAWTYVAPGGRLPAGCRRIGCRWP